MIAGDLEALAAAFVVSHEELSHLVDDRFVDLREGVDIFVIVGMNRDSDQAIVPDCLVIFCLLGFDHPDDPHPEDTTDMRRLVHQDHDVQRVAILPYRGRNEPEVERKAESFRQQTAQGKSFDFRIVVEFIPAAFGRFDNDSALATLLI